MLLQVHVFPPVAAKALLPDTGPGDEIGMLEVVMNSDTVAHIQAECGGFRGALRDDPMLLWLEKEHVRLSATSSCCSCLCNTLLRRFPRFLCPSSRRRSC